MKILWYLFLLQILFKYLPQPYLHFRLNLSNKRICYLLDFQSVTLLGLEKLVQCLSSLFLRSTGKHSSSFRSLGSKIQSQYLSFTPEIYFSHCFEIYPFFFFLRPCPQHMEFLRPGTESKPQLWQHSIHCSGSGIEPEPLQ